MGAIRWKGNSAFGGNDGWSKSKAEQESYWQSVFLYCYNDLSHITLPKILENSGITEEQYNNVLECVEKQVSIVCNSL